MLATKEIARSFFANWLGNGFFSLVMGDLQGVTDRYEDLPHLNFSSHFVAEDTVSPSQLVVARWLQTSL